MRDSTFWRRPVPALFIAAVAMAILDLVTKSLAVGLVSPGSSVTMLGDRVAWVVERNAGAALSVGQEHTWVFTVVVSLAVGFLFWWARRVQSIPVAVGVGLFLGGALGNLGDRLFRAPGMLQGHVVDWLAIGELPVFNLADVGIACGAVILGWRAAVGSRRTAPAPNSPTTANWSWAS